MRINLLSILCLVLLVPVNSMALEPVNEAHAMFYYQVPFSANKAEQKKHRFGFRMDQTSYKYGEMIQYQQLMNKTAMLDFKMGYEGVQGLYVSGVDYLQRYRLARAAEDDQGEAEDDVDASDDADEKDSIGKKIASDIGNTIEEITDIVPLGFMIGGAIGLVLITGVGD